MRVDRILFHACRLALGGIFLYAGLIKAQDVVAFAGSVANYQILSYQLNYLVAAGLPYVEMAAGLLLIVNRQVRPSALLVGGMNLVFMAALVSVIVRGLDIDCGCFRPGGEGHTTAQVALLRDVGFMALAVVTFFQPSWKKS
jgi:hypothetical protein